MKLEMLCAFFGLLILGFAFAQGPQPVTEQAIIDSANNYLQQNASNFGVSFFDLKFSYVNGNERNSNSTCPWNVNYTQTYHSIPVYDTALSLCLDKNAQVIESISVPAANDPNLMVQESLLTYPYIRLERDINIDIAPAVSKDAAKEIIKQKYGQTVEFDSSSEPTPMIVDINGPKLAWYSRLPMPIGRDLYINAQTGEIIWDYQNWVSANGTENSINNGQSGAQQGLPQSGNILTDFVNWILSFFWKN